MPGDEAPLQDLLSGLLTLLRVEFNVVISRRQGAWLLAKLFATDVPDAVQFALPRPDPPPIEAALSHLSPRERLFRVQAFRKQLPPITAGVLREGLGLSREGGS